MKKYLLIALLLLPVCVFAAEPKVTDLTATISGNTVSYSGKMEDGSTSVMCKLLNNNDEELDMLSTPVTNNTFNGTFTTSGSGSYFVTCANYSGGEFKKVSVEAATMYTFTLDPNGGTVLDIEIPTSLPAGTVLELDNIKESEVKPPKGKIFDAYEINGKRYKMGDKYTVNSDTKVKLLWKNSNSNTSKNPRTYDAGIKRSLIMLITSASIIIVSMIRLKKLNRKTT